MKKVLVLLSLLLIIGFFYFWENKNKKTENNSIIPDIHKGISGVNDLKELSKQNNNSGPLFFTTDGEPIIVSKNEELFDYNQDNLKKMSQDCGSSISDIYLQELLAKFAGTKKTVYSFKYEGGDEGVYKVILVPNKAKYKNIDQFKRDFDLCEAGGEVYPYMLNSSWLVFINSCGSGFDNKSNLINSCEKAKSIIEPNLALNF